MRPMLLLMVTGVYSQCATYDSYCLTGLSPSDYASFAAARYDYKGINEGCKYFENTQLPESFDGNVYLHWDTGNNRWYIGDSVSATTYWAYCTYSSLDSCTKGTWYIYDGTSTNNEYSVSIGACNYDNTPCLTQYNNTFSTNKHKNDAFCIRNTHHRSINKYISDSFFVGGCYETQPFYTANYKDSLWVSWDNELSVWQLNNEQNVVAWHPVAYCTYNDISYCSNNWYIWDGEDETQDSLVISGLCNTCTDTNHDTFCVYGGVGRNQWDEIIAIYNYDKCVELMHSYKHATYNDYYISNGTFGNLTFQYHCSANSWFIDIDYNTSLTVAKCDEIDNPMECSGKWSVYDSTEQAFVNTSSVQSGSCDIIYQQCYYDSSKDEQYVCITEDSNDGSVLYNEFYYEYVAGEFKYLECDQKGFPIYVRHRDNDGNYLDETWHNRSMITFDSTIYIFSVHKYNKTLKGSDNGHWLYCRALLLELCDTFWNLLDNNTHSGHWIPQSSIRITKTRCNYTNGASSSAIYWLYFGIVLTIVLLCCIGALLFYIKRRKNKNADKMAQNGYKQMIDDPNLKNTPATSGQQLYAAQTTHRSNYKAPQQIMPATQGTNQKQIVVIETMSNAAIQTKSFEHKPKESVPYKQVKKKDSYDEPPPAYDPNYDRKPTVTPKISISEMEMENVNDKMEVDNEVGDVAFGNNDIALDFIANDNFENNKNDNFQKENDETGKSESVIGTWSKEDVIEWINDIDLKEQWKQIALNAVKNGEYDGNDLMEVKGSKDISKLFGIKNPMLCSRLWKDLKKRK